MFKSLRGRLITVALVVLTAGWQLYAHKSETGQWLKLGLDLQGGMHLVLEVDDPVRKLLKNLIIFIDIFVYTF